MPIVTTSTLKEQENIIAPDPDTRRKGVEALKRLVDINIALGSEVLAGVLCAAWRCHTGQPRTPQEWEWSVTAMREAARYARERSNLIIAIEIVNRFESHLINTAEDGIRYCRDAGENNVKLHLDTFHMLHEEDNAAETIRRCGTQWIGYFHVSESNRGIPGAGMVPWADVFEALLDVGYKGRMAIECFDPHFKVSNNRRCLWRRFADTGEEVAVRGLRNLQAIAREAEARRAAKK